MEYMYFARWLETEGVPVWLIVLILDPLSIFLLAFLFREVLLWIAFRRQKDPERRSWWRKITLYGAVLIGILGTGFQWRAKGFWWLAESLKLQVESGRVRSNLEGFIDAALTTVLLVFLLVLIVRGYRYALSRLTEWESQAGAIRFQRAILLTPRRIHQTATLVLKVVRLILILELFYLYFPLILSFFPKTAPFADQIMPYVVGPFRELGYALLGYLPNLLTLLLIYLVMYYLLRALRFVFSAIGKKEIRLPGFDPQWAESTYRLVRILVVLVTIMMGYPYLPGSGTEVFQGFSVFIGAMVTLGGSASINNLISGLALTYGGAFREGDKVQVGDKVLNVVEKGLMVTHFRSLQNESLALPNSAVLAQGVTNLSTAARQEGLAIKVAAGIGYDVDWRKVHDLMLGAARKTAAILKDPAPFVLERNLADYAVNYELYAFTDQVERFAHISAELRREVLDAFNEAGVEIMTPTVNALRDANQPAIPADYKPEPLTAKGLRVERMGTGD